MLRGLAGLEEFILPLQVTLQWTFVNCVPSINTGRSQAWVWEGSQGSSRDRPRLPSAQAILMKIGSGTDT